MMTPGPITLLATIADAQAAAGAPLCAEAVAAMHALRDLIRSQPWSRPPAPETAPRVATAPAPATVAPKGAPARKAPRKPRAAAVRPEPGTKAAEDLAAFEAAAVAGDKDAGRMVKAILRCAKEERAARAFRALHPTAGPGGRVTWLDGDGRPCSPPPDLVGWCAKHGNGEARYDARTLERLSWTRPASIAA